MRVVVARPASGLGPGFTDPGPAHVAASPRSGGSGPRQAGLHLPLRVTARAITMGTLAVRWPDWEEGCSLGRGRASLAAARLGRRHGAEDRIGRPGSLTTTRPGARPGDTQLSGILPGPRPAFTNHAQTARWLRAQRPVAEAVGRCRAPDGRNY